MMNRLSLMGHLGDDPKLTTTPKGNKVATFPLPLYHVGKKEGDKTQWIECQVWNRLAEVVIEKQKKGNLVYAEGELNYTSWQNEKGEWKNRTFLTINFIRFLPSNSTASNQPVSAETQFEEHSQEPATPVNESSYDLSKQLDEMFS